MDWTRTALIVGIVLCGYMLLLRWGAHSDSMQAADEAAQSSAAEIAAIPTTPAATGAGATATPNAGDSTGLGSMPAPAGEQSAAQIAADTDTGLVAPAQATPERAGASTGAMLQIASNTLAMRIALKGGDLELLQLPRFPQRREQPDQPVALMDRYGIAHYFARQGLQHSDGTPLGATFVAPPGNYENPEGGVRVPLTFRSPDGLTLERTYELEAGSYLVTISETVHNGSGQPVSLTPYAAFYRNDYTPDTAIFGLASYLGAAWGNSEDSYDKVDFDEIRETGVRQQSLGGWVAMVQHYFVAAWVPDAEQRHLYQMSYLPNQSLYVAGLTSPNLELAPGERKTHRIQLYAGPKDQEFLSNLARGLDLTVDYGWLWWLGQPLFWILKLIHDWVDNWGWAIVALTLLIKLAIYPLSAAGFRSMAKLRQLQPDLERLRERYGEDKREMANKTMELYRKKGVNPLGGCLPLLLPMPVFLALYWVLLESVELRHAPWLLWIQDLSVRDPYFILPLLMGVSMLGSQLMSPPPATMDPVQRRMLQFMPLIFTVFFLWFPSGLVLYWLSNNLLSLAQQWWINRTVLGGK